MTQTMDDARWMALERRDADADGTFVYSVATTGVYCRPACPSKLALRRNVAFHDTCADAEKAGFRPCMRCRPNDASPDQRNRDAVNHACRTIEATDTPLSLDSLALAAGLSRFHFLRVFRKLTGVTPRQYAAQHRAARVKSELRNGASITDAIYEAGFNSSSRFYEKAPDLLGMTPRQFQHGGRGIAIQYAVAPCSLGLVLIAGTQRGICSIRFGDENAALVAELQADFPLASTEVACPEFNQWVQAVLDRIDGSAATPDLPLDIQGTAFQRRIWQALREIPSGETASYSDVAARIGQPSAVRAVARACASNPVAVIVPCHRVVRADGALSGYRWGVERKRKLLEKEGASL